jgi:Protein kinase domain
MRSERFEDGMLHDHAIGTAPSLVPWCRATMTASAPPQIIAGRYELLREVARGGMGSVWVARDRSLDREVAVKLILPAATDDAATRARFEREAKAVAGLASRHVVQIFDFGVDAGSPFLVMELLHGEDLGARLHRLQRLSIAETGIIGAQIARALAAAHHAGVIHRDLKPANIFLARIDGEEVVKILDFGIARAEGASLAAELTRTGTVLGTPQYMSPEQFRSARRADSRSDLWSLAVVLFRCLTGAPAFFGESLGDVIMAICVDPIPPASELCPDLSSDVDAFFARALERDPDRRFQSAQELSDAFSRIAAESGRPVAEAPLPASRAGAGPKSTGRGAATAAPKVARRETTDADTVRAGPAEPASPRASSAAPREPASSEQPVEEQIAFVEWDEKEGVATVLLKPGAVGRDAASIDAWKRQVSAQLARFGRKVPLLICVDGGVVTPSLAGEFGAAAKEILDRYASRFARYGTSTTIRTISAVESMKRSYKPNLFDDRASALASLKTGAG